MNDDRIAAIASLIAENLRAIGNSLKRVYPIDSSARFAELLKAIEDAEQQGVPLRSAEAS